MNMADEDGNVTNEKVFTKGQKVFVEVQDYIDGILLVMMQYGPKLYKGVLLDSSNKLNCFGVNKARIAPLTSELCETDFKTVQQPSTVDRFSYQLDGQSTVTVHPQPVLRRERKATHFARILRPRQFLCRKCKNTFEEPVDKEDPSGEEESSSASSGTFSTTRHRNRRHLLRPHKEETFRPEQQRIQRVTSSIIPKHSPKMPERDAVMDNPSSQDLKNSSSVAMGSANAEAVPDTVDSVLDAVVSAGITSDTQNDCGKDTLEVYDFQEDEKNEDKSLRKKPKRQAHEKLKDRWMREEEIRRQQEEREAKLEKLCQERSRRKRKRRSAEEVESSAVNSKPASSGSDGPAVNTDQLEVVTQRPPAAGTVPSVTSNMSPSQPVESPSPIGPIKIKINRVSQENGSYQVQLVDGGTPIASPTSSLQSDTVNGPSSAAGRRSSARARKPTKTKTAKKSRSLKTSSSSSVNVPEPEVPNLESRLVHSCVTPAGHKLRTGDVVWAKISGWPWWPSQILSLQPVATKEGHMACVQWYNWDQVSFLPADKLFPFLNSFKGKFDKKKKGAYKTAVEQAWTAAQAGAAEENVDESDAGEDVGQDNVLAVKSEAATAVDEAPQSSGSGEGGNQQDFGSELHSLDATGLALPDLGANLGRELGQFACVDIPTFSDDEEEYERRLIIDTDADRIMDRIDS